MLGTVIKVVVGLVFLASAVLQYNDPDPVAWMILYAGAALLTLLSILGHGTYGLYFVSSLAVFALFVYVARHVESWTFDSELAREAAGLGLTFFWLVVLAWLERRRASAVESGRKGEGLETG